MYTVMVTGGIGSGKSTLCKLLCEHGAVSIDLDEINRGLLQDNGDYIRDLTKRFGADILDENGDIDRSALAARAFASPEAEKDLNKIAFPYITAEASEYILDVHCTPRSDALVLVVEVPLLTEVPELIELADEVIAVTAPLDVRMQRLLDRGMDATDALNRINVQASDEERAAIADTICENGGSLEDLEKWVDNWWLSYTSQLDFEQVVNHG
jgi:dephospho-CoA kinase